MIDFKHFEKNTRRGFVDILLPALGLKILGSIFHENGDSRWVNFEMLAGSIFIPLGLLSYRGISDQAKLLYGRLCMFAGKDGICVPSLDRLSKEFARHQNMVSRWMTELVNDKFIRRKRRGPNVNASCEFLWHAALAGSVRGEPDTHREDFVLPKEVGRLMAHFNELQNCHVQQIEVRAGIPRRVILGYPALGVRDDS